MQYDITEAPTVQFSAYLPPDDALVYDERVDAQAGPPPAPAADDSHTRRPPVRSGDTAALRFLVLTAFALIGLGAIIAIMTFTTFALLGYLLLVT